MRIMKAAQGNDKRQLSFENDVDMDGKMEEGDEDASNDDD